MERQGEHIAQYGPVCVGHVCVYVYAYTYTFYISFMCLCVEYVGLMEQFA